LVVGATWELGEPAQPTSSTLVQVTAESSAVRIEEKAGALLKVCIVVDLVLE